MRPPFRRWMLDDQPFRQGVEAVLQAAVAAAGLDLPAGAPAHGAHTHPMAAWLWAKRAIAKVCRRVDRERRQAVAAETRAAADAALAARAALVAAPAVGAAQAAWALGADDEDDGEWEPPTIPNPEYKGEWKPKM